MMREIISDIRKMWRYLTAAAGIIGSALFVFVFIAGPNGLSHINPSAAEMRNESR